MVIPALGAVYGGPSKVAPCLAAALGRRGWQVDLVATNADGPDDVAAPTGRWIEQDNFRLRYFTRAGRREFKFSPSLFAWLLRHAGEYDAAHINSCFNFPVLAAATACRLRGTPYVLAPHGMLEPWALGYKAGKKARYLAAVEGPLVLRPARALQALNGQEAANLGALRLGPPAIVLPNGVGDEETQPVGPTEAEAFFLRYPTLRGKTLVLFLHRVDPKKGLDLLAPAFASARERFPQAHLVVAGPETPGFGQTARDYFQAAGVADAVTFTGMLDGTLKRGALAAASLFVAPTYSEGFSMSVLEAMAAGLPCVITTGCNFPEAGAADAARIVPVESAPFAAVMIETLANPAASRTMGERARDLVLRDYTWDQVAARFEGLSRELFDRQAA